jgi:predicted ArsR family transcriptional regulator
VPDPSSTIELTDPRALRAVAHPIRLQLVGLLRREGPLTATRAGELLGESPASCSFHLRQLAKYGLVEEAGGGRGRERPWRATALFTCWPGAARDPELAAASDLLSRVVAERYFEQLMRWIDVRAGERPEWQEAEVFGDRMLYLTSDELAELGRELDALLDRFTERTASRELRPDGSRLVTFIRAAFPQPDES